MTHKATPEQWDDAGAFASDTRACLFELRDRIAALEAQRETEKACIQDIYEKLDRLKVQHESNWTRIVKLEDAGNHPESPDGSSVPADPRISLVATVDQAMFDARNETTHEAACAVIDVVACWLDSQNVGAGHAAARWLREEVERG